MKRLNTFIAQLFICSISAGFAINALASEKNIVLTIPSPMGEFLKTEDQPPTLQAKLPGCQSNEQFLYEKEEDYKRRLSNIKWNKANHFCDARFKINHIIASEVKTPFHHMSVDAAEVKTHFHHMSVGAALEASATNEWAKIVETETSYLVTFIATPFSLETMGTAEELSKLYARRIWKLTSQIGMNNIGDIVINKTEDNARVIDALINELTSPSRKIIGDSNYSLIARKIQVKIVTDNVALSPTFRRLAEALRSYEQERMTPKNEAEAFSAEENPSALVLIALHNYFSEFQRIDFSTDNKTVKILKSVNNGTKTVRLLKELQKIIKDHPEALQSLSESVLAKLKRMFTVNSAVTTENTETNHLASLMAAVPNILMSDVECANITNILINVITSSGGVVTEYTLEELLSKSMAALSPLIAEMAIDSINNLISSANVSINYQPVAADESRIYSSVELSRLFFKGIDLSSQNEFQDVFLQINSIFARLKEFYLHAYDGILLFEGAKPQNDRTPAAVEENDRIEQVLNASNCLVQKYKFKSQFFNTSDAELEFKKIEQDAAISIPITRAPVDQSLSMDMAKQEIEKQLTAAANSLPRVISSAGAGQLEQLLAVLSQQSVSIADILRNTSFNGSSNFYFQIILSPTDVFDVKKAMTGKPFPVSVKNLLPEKGDPLCDARNVVIVLDYLFDSTGNINLKLQWGMQLPRHFTQPLSEFTNQHKGLIVKNSPGKPDQIHISDFQLMPLKKNNLSHFALFTLSANGQLGLKNITANVKFGPQMNFVFDRQFIESKALNFTNKQNVFIGTPNYDFFNSFLKNSDNSTKEILWSVGVSQGANLVNDAQNLWSMLKDQGASVVKSKDIVNSVKLFWSTLKDQGISFARSNVCTENETYGPLLNLTKAYPQPLQETFNKIGMYNVLMHSGRARLDELELSLYIDPSKIDDQDYSPTVKMNKFELQVFPYNMEGNYYPEKDKYHLINPQGSNAKLPSGQKVMMNLGHWLCFPLPHNKEIGIMNNVTETINAQMPNIWKQTKTMLNQIRSIIGNTIHNPTSDVAPIDTDNYPETKAGE